MSERLNPKAYRRNKTVCAQSQKPHLVERVEQTFHAKHLKSVLSSNQDLLCRKKEKKTIIVSFYFVHRHCFHVSAIQHIENLI